MAGEAEATESRAVTIPSASVLLDSIVFDDETGLEIVVSLDSIMLAAV